MMTEASAEEEFHFPSARTGPFEAPSAYGRAREQGLVEATMYNGCPTWLATRYADVTSILTDRRFSSDVLAPNLPLFSKSRAQAQTQHIGLRDIDPPEHTRLRRIFAPLFTVRNMQKFRPRLEEFVDTVIQDVLEKGPPSEFCEDFAQRITVWSIVELMGLPHDDERFFHECSQSNLFHTRDANAAERAITQMEAYLESFLAKKEENPVEGEDIVTRLVLDQVIPGHLSRRMATSLLANLVLNGQDTTGNQIVLGVLGLLTYPDQLEKINANPALLSNAIDEMLRFFTIAVAVAPRTALEDLELGGKCVRQGDGVVASVMSANRDPAVFHEPDLFDIERDNLSRHVAFGQGIHSCVGRPLALVELDVVFGRLFKAIPGLKLAVPVSEIRGTGEAAQAYGLLELPLTW
jgi:cytochrome P450